MGDACRARFPHPAGRTHPGERPVHATPSPHVPGAVTPSVALHAVQNSRPARPPRELAALCPQDGRLQAGCAHDLCSFHLADAALDAQTVKDRLKAKGFESDLAEILAMAATARTEPGERFAKIENDLLWIKRTGGAILLVLACASGFFIDALIDMSADLGTIQATLTERGNDIAKIQEALSGLESGFVALADAIAALGSGN